MKVDSEGKTHAKFSASGSERWLNCPGSILLSEQAPPPKESVYAKEGTDAHTCFEVFLKNRKAPIKKVTAMLNKRFPHTMVHAAFESAGYVVSQAPPDSEIICETKVDLDFVEPGTFGTVDAGIIDLFGTLWVGDLKYGAGRLVDPTENTQMIFYALGLAHKYHYNFERARLVVIQPRIVHKDGFNRSWDIDMRDLMKWADKFKDGIEKAKDPFAELKAGRWCFFCPAQSICPAIEREQFAEAQADFDEVV